MAKYLKIWREEKWIKIFTFRLGEPHIVFSFLKVIAKYILGSCIDQMLNETEVYGPTTIGKTFEANHMKQGMKANMII